ncbi:MAG: hypothetical protein WD771_00540 [Gemmatimonadaceae bacterium]
MPRNLLRRSAAILLATLIVGCGGSDADAEDAAREIELPPAGASEPLNDQAATVPAPVTRTPAQRPPAPAANRSGTIAAGTALSLTSGTRVCTNTHKAGDNFTATLTAPVVGTNGAVLATGTEVTLQVVESVRGRNDINAIRLGFGVVAITRNGVTTGIVGDVTQVAGLDTERLQTNQTQAGKVVTGAAIGAVAGQILGKNTKSTIAGAAIGAAAGGAVAAATTDYDGCLPANSSIVVVLREAFLM